MTGKELSNLANRINKRIDNLVKQFGRKSASVVQYETMIKANFPNARYEKGDVLHISRSVSKLEKTFNVAEKFEKFLNAPTVGDIKKKAVEQLAEEGIDAPTWEEINSRANLMQSAEEIIKNNAYKYDMFEDEEGQLNIAKELVHIEDRRKTWAEIDKIVDILKKDYTNARIKEPKNEMEAIEGVYR